MQGRTALASHESDVEHRNQGGELQWDPNREKQYWGRRPISKRN